MMKHQKQHEGNLPGYEFHHPKGNQFMTCHFIFLFILIASEVQNVISKHMKLVSHFKI